MFKCRINNENVFKTFLRSTDSSDYIDVLLNQGTSLFISNSTAVFSCLRVETETPLIYEPFECRIPLKILKNFVCSGYFYIDNTTDGVSMSFYNDKDIKLGDVLFPLQNIFTDGYTNKLELMKNANSFGKSFKTKELSDICKVCKIASSTITVGSGVVGCTLSNRARLFYVPEDETLLKQKFAISATGLSLLMSVSDELFSIENYLCAANKGLTVLVTKSVGGQNDEFELLELAKAKYQCTIDINSVVVFLRNMKISTKTLSLDLNKGYCEITEAHVKYRIPFSVKDTKTAPGVTLDTIELPMSVINEMFAGLDMKFFVERKKNFIKISTGNTFIYL